MAAVNPVTSCRQIFKELRILTIASLYILEVISFKKTPPVCRAKLKYSHIQYTREMDIHIQSYKTDLHNRSAVNMGSKLYSKLTDYIKKKESYKHFRKELKSFLLLHTFYSVEESVAL
jgi:hypothetical protein